MALGGSKDSRCCSISDNGSSNSGRNGCKHDSSKGNSSNSDNTDGGGSGSGGEVMIAEVVVTGDKKGNSGCNNNESGMRWQW